MPTAKAAAVIHTAFDRDFSRVVENCDKDRRVVEAMAGALADSSRPLIIMSGTGMGSFGSCAFAVETVYDRVYPYPRRPSELTAKDFAKRGVSALVRLPQIHDTVKQGLVSPAIQIARQKGVSACASEGANRWRAAHVIDVKRLYRLPLDKHELGARWHAVAERAFRSARSPR